MSVENHGENRFCREHLRTNGDFSYFIYLRCYQKQIYLCVVVLLDYQSDLKSQ